MGHRYIFLDEADSTNNYAKSTKDFPNDKLTVIRAGRQTGGRGRGGKSFFSNHAGGLWVSIVTPVNDISTHFKHNRAISLAILESLKNITGKDTQVLIKWPNDIYVNDKKITGILLENIHDNPNMLIIGFGINVNTGIDDFPEGLRDSATSVLMETGREIPLDLLLDDVISKYCKYADNGDQAAVHELYCNNLYKRGCLSVVDGRIPSGCENFGGMLLPGGASLQDAKKNGSAHHHTGKFVTVDIDGRLRLETDSGDVLCHSGTLRFLEGGNNE